MADEQTSNLVLPVGWTPASVLMNATGDAMDNIYDIIIKFPWQGAATNNSIESDAADAATSYRASKFDIPEPKENTYDVEWRGVKVKKVGTGVMLERTFTLEFRLDANYALHQKFIAWEKLVHDVNTSGVANTASALGTVQVVAPGAEYNAMSWSTPTSANDEANMAVSALPNTTNLVWTFEDVAVVSVGQPKFKTAEKGSKMSYQVKFIFGDVAYPFYSGANGVGHSRGRSAS